MAKARWSVKRLLWQASFFLLGALLTGFLTVFFAKFLGHYIGNHWAVVSAVGLGVSLTLWVSQLLKQPPFILKGTSPFIAGLCAALGVHVSRTWLN
ncbi:MAG: hypothetical protein JNJ55_11655 [Betaproteobacteria bacterium]|nr:hypothetical protein [Betaproteobacteria bacterium]